MFSLAMMRPADFERPLQPWPCSQEETIQSHSHWRAYPSRTKLLDSCDYHYLHELCQLSDICVDFQGLLFGVDHLDGSKLIGIVDDSHSRLQAWYEHNSPLLTQNKLLPGVMLLTLSYHLSLMILFGFCRYPRNEGLPSSLRRVAKETCVSSARAIASTLARHCEQHGTRPLPPFIALATQCALFVLLTDLDSPESADAFITCCRVLELLTQNWKLPRALLRMVSLTASHLGVMIPPAAKSILEKFGSGARITTADGQQMSSGLPNYALLLSEGPASVATSCLSDLLERWQRTGASDSDGAQR